MDLRWWEENKHGFCFKGKEILLPMAKEITDGETASLDKGLREGNSHSFLGMGEWQVVRQVTDAALGKSGKVS